MVSFKTLFHRKNAFFLQNFSEVKKRCDKDNPKTPLSSGMIDGGGLWRCSAGDDRYLRDERHFLFPPISISIPNSVCSFITLSEKDFFSSLVVQDNRLNSLLVLYLKSIFRLKAVKTSVYSTPSLPLIHSLPLTSFQFLELSDCISFFLLNHRK